ncbi:unannotated protein [freshwater metagenome]|uniref:Unannotated protein n=1 Tax=freshwater metagenome TaxID=449393 RepID=A0A6J6JTT8_9ZZZZ
MARLGASEPAASDATLACTIPANWATTIMPNIHDAALPVVAKPTPLQRKSGWKPKPALRQKASRISACAATARVVEPARTATISLVQALAFPVSALGKSAPKTMSPVIATILLTAGAHVKGPKILRALRTSLSKLYSA